MGGAGTKEWPLPMFSKLIQDIHPLSKALITGVCEELGERRRALWKNPSQLQCIKVKLIFIHPFSIVLVLITVAGELEPLSRLIFH